MSQLDVALIEWPAGERGGPRLVARSSSQDLVRAVLDHLRSERLDEVKHLDHLGERRPRLVAADPVDPD